MPAIDANVHATPDGRWFHTTYNASVAELLRQLDEAEVERAVVTGIAPHMTTDGVLGLCAEHPDRLVPVGAFDPSAHQDGRAAAKAARAELPDRGLVGFKLHPRLGGYDVLDPRALAVLDEAASWSEPLPVWVCGLLHVPGKPLTRSPVEALHELTGRYPTLKIVIAHGGGPDILRLATAVRQQVNVFLDLSYTLTAYRGSSVDLDLEYLMGTFDNRLLFGSDFPEVRIRDARDALEQRGAAAGAAAREKVLGGNLSRLLTS